MKGKPQKSGQNNSQIHRHLEIRELYKTPTNKETKSLLELTSHSN